MGVQIVWHVVPRRMNNKRIKLIAEIGVATLVVGVCVSVLGRPLEVQACLHPTNDQRLTTTLRARAMAEREEQRPWEKVVDLEFRVGDSYIRAKDVWSISLRNKAMGDLMRDIYGDCSQELDKIGMGSQAFLVERTLRVIAHAVPNAVDAVFKRIDIGQIKPEEAVIKFRFFVDRNSNSFRLELIDNGEGIKKEVLEAWERGEIGESTSTRTDEKSLFIGEYGDGVSRGVFPSANSRGYNVRIETKREDEPGYVFNYDRGWSDFEESGEIAEVGTRVIISGSLLWLGERMGEFYRRVNQSQI